MNSNAITAIQKDAFSGLTSLSILEQYSTLGVSLKLCANFNRDLSQNSIEFLEHGAFNDLTKLKVLPSHIALIQHQHSSNFMNTNVITSITPDAFSGLEALWYLPLIHCLKFFSPFKSTVPYFSSPILSPLSTQPHSTLSATSTISWFWHATPQNLLPVFIMCPDVSNQTPLPPSRPASSPTTSSSRNCTYRIIIHLLFSHYQ